MSEIFSRTELLLGEDAVKKLSGKRVAVFGVGGVGGYVCEALVRSGIGAFDLCDNDTIALSNINRQIIATMSSVGRSRILAVSNWSGVNMTFDTVFEPNMNAPIVPINGAT